MAAFAKNKRRKGGLIGFLTHLFIPKESNNHRAKILHHNNIFLTIVFLLLATFFIQKIKATYPTVLGISADISSEQLLALTNSERRNVGAGDLVLNDKLSQAAAAKADDMLANNYWAHVSPSGTTPWVFIKSAGYEYVYAGENLARGFTDSNSVVRAWMESPDHRANMLSSNYRDVGFAIKVGMLNGEETVLVVEEFGNLSMPVAQNTKTQDIQAAKTSQEVPVKVEEEAPAKAVGVVPEKNIQTVVKKQPVIDSSALSSNIYYVLIFVFIFALLLDMIIIEKKKIMRFVGHNLDHILYLLLVLFLAGIWSKGVII